MRPPLFTRIAFRAGSLEWTGREIARVNPDGPTKIDYRCAVCNGREFTAELLVDGAHAFHVLECTKRCTGGGIWLETLPPPVESHSGKRILGEGQQP